MDLAQLRQQFLGGQLNIMQVGHRLKHVQKELDDLYPFEGPPLAKFWVYVNDDHSVYCTKSSRFKTFEGWEQGFRKFCGNQGVCECNQQAMRHNKLERTQDQQLQINLKRKTTNRSKYGVDFASQLEQIKQKAAQTCIEKYGTSSPMGNINVQQKSQQTCLQNHGVSWPQQNPDIFARTVETFRQQLGVDRPAQAEEFRQRSKERERSRGFLRLIERLQEVKPLFDQTTYTQGDQDTKFLYQCCECNKEFLQSRNEYRTPRCLVCYPARESWGETFLKKWLLDQKVEFVQWDRTRIAPLELDFLLEQQGLAIEFNGTWHHREEATSSRSYHQQKWRRCQEQGLRLIQIWEHELHQKPHIVVSRLSHALGLNTSSVPARKCEIKSVSVQEARQFFNQHHLQGWQGSSMCLGLYKEDQLMCAASFSKNRFGSLAEYELLRYAVADGISVPGGLGRLVKRAQAQLGFKSLVSYANLNWGEGLGYREVGFVLNHVSKPNYWYFKGLNEIHSRLRFQKHRIAGKAVGNSESEIARNMGYLRFFDAGNAVWIRRW